MSIISFHSNSAYSLITSNGVSFYPKLSRTFSKKRQGSLITDRARALSSMSRARENKKKSAEKIMTKEPRANLVVHSVVTRSTYLAGFTNGQSRSVITILESWTLYLFWGSNQAAVHVDHENKSCITSYSSADIASDERIINKGNKENKKDEKNQCKIAPVQLISTFVRPALAFCEEFSLRSIR